MSVEMPEPAEVARRLFGAAAALHAIGFVFVLGMTAIAVPLDLDVGVGASRQFAFLGAASLGSYAIAAARTRRHGRRLREAIRRRREAPDAAPPETALVRSVHLLPTQTSSWTIVAVVLAALADVTGLLPVSGLAMPARLAVALLCVTALQVIAHAMAIRGRRELWAFLHEIHPDDVTIEAPQRFDVRLGSRVLSAALVPALCLAAVVLGRPGLEAHGGGLLIVLVGMATAALVAVLVAIRIGRLAERDMRAVAAHVDLLLARGPLDSGTVSEWGEEPMRTNAAAEVVDAMHVLASRYARLASEEERARRAVEEAHMLRTRFMAYMSHDLRSPLNSITGFAEVLAMESEGPLNEEQMESVLAIRESGQDLVRLVTNLVDAARLEAGRMTIYPAWTPVVSLAEEAILRAQRGGRTPGPSIRIDEQPGLPTVYVDAERTVQAISALLFHLLRECDSDESAAIRIRLHLAPAARSAVFVDVHGRGRLDARAYTRILESFPGAEHPGGRGPSGMRIGLVLCRDLIMVQGGLMWCEDAGRGETLFRIRLPADPRALGRASAADGGGDGAFD